MTELLECNHYLIRKKLLKILGEKFHIYSDDSQEILIGYSYQKALKIKEDIRVYTDENESEEIIKIKARNIFDFSGNYDFTDLRNGESLGGIRRHLRKSLFQDSYSVFGPDNQIFGEIKEDRMFNALVRRFVPFAKYVLPQQFTLNVPGNPPTTFTQKMNPVIQKLTVDIPEGNQLDPRIILGSAMVIIAIEGRQN
tara:strand:+ start:8118 stop:8705 length:588 start_codon:yes stop_codon:yes gene_type:complete